MSNTSNPSNIDAQQLCIPCPPSTTNYQPNNEYATVHPLNVYPTQPIQHTSFHYQQITTKPIYSFPHTNPKHTNKRVRCRFGRKCSNRKCRFFHPGDNNNTPKQKHTNKLCKYGNNCNFSSKPGKCRFIHPGDNNNTPNPRKKHDKDDNNRKQRFFVAIPENTNVLDYLTTNDTIPTNIMAQLMKISLKINKNYKIKKISLKIIQNRSSLYKIGHHLWHKVYLPREYDTFKCYGIFKKIKAKTVVEWIQWINTVDRTHIADKKNGLFEWQTLGFYDTSQDALDFLIAQNPKEKHLLFSSTTKNILLNFITAIRTLYENEKWFQKEKRKFRKSKFACYKCGKLGHIQKDCFSKYHIDGYPVTSADNKSQTSNNSIANINCLRCGRDTHKTIYCTCEFNPNGDKLPPYTTCVECGYFNHKPMDCHLRQKSNECNLCGKTKCVQQRQLNGRCRFDGVCRDNVFCKYYHVIQSEKNKQCIFKSKAVKYSNDSSHKRKLDMTDDIMSGQAPCKKQRVDENMIQIKTDSKGGKFTCFRCGKFGHSGVKCKCTHDVNGAVITAGPWKFKPANPIRNYEPSTNPNHALHNEQKQRDDNRAGGTNETNDVSIKHETNEINETIHTNDMDTMESEKVQLNCCNCNIDLRHQDIWRCSKCKVSFYCGKKCQLNHWKTHQMECGKSEKFKSQDIKIERVSVNEWNCYAIIYWFNRVNNSIFNDIKYMELRKHIIIANIKACDLVSINNVTLRMMGINNVNEQQNILNAFSEVIMNDNFDNYMANIMKTDLDTIPWKYMDPVMYELMDEPVKVRQCGTIYNKSFIVKYVTENRLDPITQRYSDLADIIQCEELNTEIEMWKKKHFIA